MRFVLRARSAPPWMRDKRKSHLHSIFKLSCWPGEKILEVLSHIRDTITNTNQPWYRWQWTKQVHAILEQSNGKMKLIIFEHVQRFSESQIAHNVEWIEVEQRRNIDWIAIRFRDALEKLFCKMQQSAFILLQSYGQSAVSLFRDRGKFSPWRRKASSHILRLFRCISLSLVVATDTRGCIISYHAAFEHLVPTPSSALTASGLKIEISFGPSNYQKAYVD